MTTQDKNVKHFSDLDILDSNDLKSMISTAKKLKSLSPQEASKLLQFKNLALIFEKNSTRTRVSFEAGINQLGGNAIVIDKNSSQLDTGELISDTAKVLSGLVDMVMIRCGDHDRVKQMCDNSTIPIINGLTDYSHPCQILASVLTIEESLGDIKGKKLSWFGDANNVLNSYIHGAEKFGYELNIALPENSDFCNREIKKAKDKGSNVHLYRDAKAAAKNSDVLITDTWFSMGDEVNTIERQKKINSLRPFRVTKELMSLAKDSAVFTHCLPAYRDFEVSEEVIDSSRSIAFKEAHNRLHAQKAIMLWLNNIEI